MEICHSYRCAVSKHSKTAALFRANCNPHCSVSSANQAHSRRCVTAVTPVEIRHSYRCAMSKHSKTAALFRANCNPHCSVSSANQAHSRHCVTAITLVEICLSYICAVTKHQCIAAIFRANHIPDCSVLLLKTGSQQALCHCSCTSGDLPFIHLCSEQAPMHCSKVQGKSHSPLLSAALEYRVTAGSVSLQLHL